MTTFAKSGLSEEIQRAINELGFENPTPIQKETIPRLLKSKKDFIGLAQTGTGKTAAFGLPIIEQTDTESKETRTLILCPTRELCMQITKDLKSYAKYVENINITPVYGGASIDTQIRALKKGSQIVVGTPGRILDLVERKRLILSDIQFLILDEADEMLSMGFKDALDSILSETPSDKQTMLFSATMSPEIRRISQKYMNKPDEVSIGKQNVGAENVDHTYYVVHSGDRYEALKRITDANPDIYGIVFCRTREDTKHIAEKLMHDGYNADALHGDLTQDQRDKVMNRFRSGHLQLLVATDVAARGIDVSDLTHIINYDLPDEIGLYIHRSGRTGRAGKNGSSISILHTREMQKVRILEKQVGKKFERKQVPSGKDVCEKQLFSFINKISNVQVDEVQIEQYLPDIYENLQHLDREELIKHFVSVELNRFLDYYKDAKDLNTVVIGNSEFRNRTTGSDRGRRSLSPNYSSREGYSRGNNGYSSGNGEGDRNGSGRRRSYSNEDNEGPRNGRSSERNFRNNDVTFSRFYINVGEKHKMTPPRIIGIINERMQSNEASIGKISIMDKLSAFDIDTRYESDVITAFEDARFENRPLMVELVGNEPPKRTRKKS